MSQRNGRRVVFNSDARSCRQVAPNYVLTSHSYVTVNFDVFVDNKISLCAYYATSLIDGHKIVSYSVATHLTWTCPEARPQ